MCLRLAGVHFQDVTVAGMQSPQDNEFHVDNLEMKAVQLAINTFLGRVMGEVLLLVRNSTTVVAYLQKQGGTVSLIMCKLVQIIAGSKLYMVSISARYIPGKESILTDHLNHLDQVLLTK